MPLQKSTLQPRSSGGAPPKKESFQEWLAKMVTQQAVGGLAQFGTQTAVDWATDDMKKQRQIAVNEAGARHQTQGRIVQDATDDTRSAFGEVFATEAGLNDELGSVRQLLTTVAKSSTGATTRKEFLTMKDFLTDETKAAAERLQTVRNQKPDTAGMTPAQKTATTQKHGNKLRRMEKYIGQLKSLSITSQRIKNPKLLQSMVNELVRAGESDILQAKKDNWKVFRERLAFNVEASKDPKTGISPIKLNWESIEATKESRQVMALANAAVSYERNALLREMGPKKYDAFIASQAMGTQGYAMKPHHLHPAIGRGGAPNPLHEKYQQHFPPHMRRMMGLREKNWDTSALNDPWVTGIGFTAGQTTIDRGDAAVRKVVGGGAGPKTTTPAGEAAAASARLSKVEPEHVAERWPVIARVRESGRDALEERVQRGIAKAGKETYRIEHDGSTLVDVSKKTGIPVRQLQFLNKTRKGEEILPDQKLRRRLELKLPREPQEYTPYSEFFGEPKEEK